MSQNSRWTSRTLFRKHQNSLLVSLFALGITISSSSVVIAEPDLGGVTEKHVMIKMRHGWRLSAYLYFPEGDGPWPVLMEQRYASLRGDSTRKSFADLAKHGYVVAGVNFRGTHKSEGKYVGYRALGWGRNQDGYDTVEWLAKQPWSTGKVGTFGSSQAGFAQNFLAVTRPPHLVCQYMTDTGLSLFHEGYRIGGATKPNRFKSMAKVCRVPRHNRQMLEEWFQHPHYDDYWKDEDCTLHFDKMNVPCFTIGSWYDYMCTGSVQSFVGRQHHGGNNSRGQQRLVVGPWLHGRYNKTNKVRDVEYPTDANFDVPQSMLTWFDYYLKGIGDNPNDAPPVRYYVMGACNESDSPGNEWRTSNDWPIPTVKTDYFLNSSGKLGKAKPSDDGGETVFKADPINPAKIPSTGFPGAADARKVEEQEDVITFTTDFLKEPVEWTGLVQTELYVSSTARDTDFIVRVSDVYPDGKSILIIDMIRRARYREGFEQEKLLEPGKVEKVAFDVGWLSQVFNRGHRIRVTVCSTGAPFYEPNPNTGKPLTIETPDEQVIAENTVYHNQKYASKVIAPIPAP